MADIKEKITFDDSGVIAGLTNQYALITKVDKALRETEQSYKEAFETAEKQINESKKVTEEGTKAIGKHIVATNEAKTASGGWKDALKELGDSINIMGVNLGSTISNLKAKANALKTVSGAIGGTTQALKVFKVALISTGIGAIVVALGALVALFAKSEKAIDKAEQVMSAFGAAVNVVIDRAVKLGEAIVKVFQGDFKGALNDGKESFKGLTGEIAKQATEAVRLTKELQRLEDVNREINIQNEINKGQISELLNLSVDQNKSLKERVSVLEQVRDLEIEIARNEAKRAIEAFDIYRDQLAQKKNITDAERDQYNSLQVAAIAAENNIEAVQYSSTRRISSLREQEAAKQQQAHEERMANEKAYNDALQEQADKIIQLADKIHNEGLDPESKALAEHNFATLQINEMFRVLAEKEKAAGIELNLEEDKAALILAINNKLQRDLESIRNEALPKLSKAIIEPLKVSERAAVDIVGNVQGAVKQMADNPEVGNAIDNLKLKLSKAFKLDEDELKEAFSSISNSIGSIFESLTSGTDAAIEKNNEFLESIREKQSVLNDDLEKELERQELGLANSVDGKRRELEALKKEEEKAEKEREKLRRKQLAAKLVSDSISQGSSLVTMAANVVQAESGKGLLGVAFALAAIAAFLGIFTQLKNSQKKLYKGGPLDQEGVTGFVNPQGRTDKHGGRGHRVEDSNVVLGGKEFVVAEGPANEHAAFLADLNDGKFTGKNLRDEIAARGLHFAIGHNAEHEHNEAIIRAATSRNTDHIIAEAIDKSLQKHVDRLINSKETAFAYSPGQIVVREKNGVTHITETVADWRWKPER